MAAVNHFYDEETSPQNHTGTDAWTDASCVVLGSALAATTNYLIVARGLFSGGAPSRVFHIRVETGDDSEVAAKSESSMEPTLTATDEHNDYFWVHSFQTDASPANVRIQIKTTDTGQTVTSDQMSLLLIDLDDLGSSNFFEAVGADTNTELAEEGGSPDWTEICALTDSDLGTTEEWLLLGYGRVRVAGLGRWFQVQLRGADDSATISVLNQNKADGEDPIELRVVGLMGRHKAVTSNVAAAVRANEESTGANHDNGGGYIIAIKASAFEDFEHDYTAADFTVTTTEQTIAEITDYTPTTNVDHLILGRSNVSDATANSRLLTHVRKNSSCRLACRTL